MLRHIASGRKGNTRSRIPDSSAHCSTARRFLPAMCQGCWGRLCRPSTNWGWNAFCRHLLWGRRCVALMRDSPLGTACTESGTSECQYAALQGAICPSAVALSWGSLANWYLFSTDFSDLLQTRERTMLQIFFLVRLDPWSTCSCPTTALAEKNWPAARTSTRENAGDLHAEGKEAKSVRRQRRADGKTLPLEKIVLADWPRPDACRKRKAQIQRTRKQYTRKERRQIGLPDRCIHIPALLCAHLHTHGRHPFCRLCPCLCGFSHRDHVPPARKDC